MDKEKWEYGRVSQSEADGRREFLEGKKVTIDGDEAQICGIALKYPQVHNMKTKATFEFSWAAIVEVITNRNGEFRS